MGGDRSHFVSVFGRLAERSTVVSYDRSGYGESDPAPSGGDGLAWRTRELDVLLANLNPPTPYVIVGHSMGALIACLFAVDHPAKVGAVVSIDGDDGVPPDLPAFPVVPP